MQELNPTETCSLAFQEPLEKCCYEAPSSEWPCIPNVHISNKAFNVWPKHDIDNKSMHLVATASIICSKCVAVVGGGVGGGEIAPLAMAGGCWSRRVALFSMPRSIWWPFPWQNRWQRIIIFQRRWRWGAFSGQICQNGNASSGWELNLCHGSRWPPTGVDDAFKDLKREHSAAAAEEVPFLKTLAVQWTDELPESLFLTLFIFSTKRKHHEKEINSHKQIPRERIKESNICTRVSIVRRLGLCLHIVFVVEKREQCSSCTGRTSQLTAPTAPALPVFVCLDWHCVVCFLCGCWLQLSTRLLPKRTGGRKKSA